MIATVHKPFWKTGYTLAELLTVVWLLGIISAYTIPKVLASSANATRNAVFKETISSVFQVLHNGRTMGAYEFRFEGFDYLSNNMTGLTHGAIESGPVGSWGNDIGANTLVARPGC